MNEIEGGAMPGYWFILPGVGWFFYGVIPFAEYLKFHPKG